MNWHEFIFSKKRNYRLLRHGLFWVIWWLYFIGTYYYYLQVGLQSIRFGEIGGPVILQTLCLVLVHMVACYCFMYVLLLQYLVKERYLSFAGGMVVLIVGLILGGYLLHSGLFTLIDPDYEEKLKATHNTMWWVSINSVLLTSTKIIAAASAIMLVKRWYVKQKEKERLEKEKLITDLQLLKAQVRPDFLFSSLDHIYHYAKNKSSEAPGLLLRFSDLLSYLLYECESPTVPLSQEIAMLKEYMAIEKLRFGSRLEMEIDVKGVTDGTVIAPLLLLPFVEQSFRQCSQFPGQSWINLELSVEENLFTMKLMNGVQPGDVVPDFATVKKRLQMLYPDNYDLKIYIEQEIAMSFLRITLTETQFLVRHVGSMQHSIT